MSEASWWLTRIGGYLARHRLVWLVVVVALFGLVLLERALAVWVVMAMLVGAVLGLLSWERWWPAVFDRQVTARLRRQRDTNGPNRVGGADGGVRGRGRSARPGGCGEGGGAAAGAALLA